MCFIQFCFVRHIWCPYYLAGNLPGWSELSQHLLNHILIKCRQLGQYSRHGFTQLMQLLHKKKLEFTQVKHMFHGKWCVFTTVLNLLPCYFSLASQWQSTCMQAYGKYKDASHQKTEMSAYWLWKQFKTWIHKWSMSGDT